MDALTITNPDLARLAEALHVTLAKHNGGKKGYWNPSTRTISTRRGLSIAEYRSTLAHEIAHAFHGDKPGGGKRQENRADLWAANLLLNPKEVADAIAWNSTLETAAYDLEVTAHLLEVWLAQPGRMDNIEVNLRKTA